MARFISDDKIPVFLDEDPEHIIYIRERMNVGIQSRVMSTIASIKAQSVAQTGAGGQIIGLDMGAYNLALLTCNIVGWAGPDFERMECTPANIEKLDPNDPLLDKVLAEINRRNVKPAEGNTSPNLPTKNGQWSVAVG